jgi:hypothetical protein
LDECVERNKFLFIGLDKGDDFITRAKVLVFLHMFGRRGDKENMLSPGNSSVRWTIAFIQR